MKKVLIVTSVASMIKQFNMENIQLLQEIGYHVTVATNFKVPGTIPVEEAYKLRRKLKELNITSIQVDFHRNPISKSNLKSLINLNKIINDNQFDLIHCQSPVGGALTRIAARKARKKGTKIIYTAHGFHFYKGAPLLNWIIYYPMERILARFTDTIITINKEDFIRAKSFSINDIYLFHGVGIHLEKFNFYPESSFLKESLGISENSKTLLSVGEINHNKNHEIVIKALYNIKNPDIHYIICGTGEDENKLNELITKLNLEKQVHLLGYREDVQKIYSAVDIFIFPSFREGLSVALMEAMASGLPIIASNIRGNIDLVDVEQGGFLFNPYDEKELSEYIIKLMNNLYMWEKIGEYNKEKIKNFSLETVLNELESVYINEKNV